VWSSGDVTGVAGSKPQAAAVAAGCHPASTPPSMGAREKPLAISVKSDGAEASQPQPTSTVQEKPPGTRTARALATTSTAGVATGSTISNQRRPPDRSASGGMRTTGGPAPASSTSSARRDTWGRPCPV
jgi:hypothetical protein